MSQAEPAATSARSALERVAPGRDAAENDASAPAVGRAIYGPTDDRQDLYRITDSRLLNDAKTVVSLFRASQVTALSGGMTRLTTQRYGDRPDLNLCDTEPFVDQPSGSFGSGFLVGRDVIATAAHTLTEVPLEQTRYVFGYAMPTATSTPTLVKTADVYRGVQVIASALVPGGADWALIRLDRPVKNGRIASVRRSGTVPTGQPVHIIGHPRGLPLKVAGNATVTGNTHSQIFEASFDALKGNSGSPVINSVTHEVEGVYVRSGYTIEFVPGPSGDCNVTRLVPLTPGPNSSGPDEECTRTTVFAHLLGPGWQELDDNPATVAIAAGAPLGPLGPALYQLHGTGALWRYNGTPMVGWELLDANQATVELATDGSTLYQRHSGSGHIWRYTNIPLIGWERVGGSSQTKTIVATRGLENGWLYELHRDGRIWRFNSGNPPLTGWELLDSNASTTAIAADRDRLYQLHQVTGAIWQYTGEAGFEWVQLGGNPLTKQILASGGQLYQLQSDGVIWRYTGTPMTGWQQLDKNANTTAIAHDGLRLFKLHKDGSVWRYSGFSVTGWQQIDDNPDTKAIVGAGRQLYQRIGRPRVGTTPAIGSIKRLVG